MPVLVLGAGRRCWCCELAVHAVETGCLCWCWAPGAGAVGAVSWLCTGAGAGAVSWLRAWWS